MTKTAQILFLIDTQKGFSRHDLSLMQGGCLYVPDGEKAGEPAAQLLQNMGDSFIVLSQDYHPDGHISFMTSHPAVMAWRKERLAAMGHPAEKLDELALDPLILPFDDIMLKKGDDGRYRAIACGVGAEWREVATNEHGCITAIGARVLAEEEIKDVVRQKLWRPHCRQGTESAMFVEPVMDELPFRLCEALENRAMDSAPYLTDTDGVGNTYYAIRKGVRQDLDSYGVATENDLVSHTAAISVFREMARSLQQKGFTEAAIYIGGLATNFCTEYSHDDVHKILVPMLREHGIEARVYLLTDISYGIPIKVPGGAWPDLAAAQSRMEAMGTKSCTTGDVIRALRNADFSQPFRLMPSPG